MRGCDNFCSYCIVPYVRGRERSRPPEDVCAEISAMAGRGVRDVTLVGQNVNSYRQGGLDFPALLRRVAGIETIRRVRFITSHPKDCNRQLLQTMAGQTKICPHLPLPLQSGADRILGLMNRGYTSAHFAELAGQARAVVPGLVLTSDVIVGFPGETESEFRETLALVERLRFAAAFTYRYSQRPGTKAAELPDQLPEEIKLRRLDELIKLQNRITLESNQADVGKTVEVMVEGPSKKGGGQLMGRTPGNKVVAFDAPAGLAPGALTSVLITTATPGTLIGKIG
jgi:tRNA-2-methylthio-N6-dimethylallyladenosine synthase